MSLSMIKFLGFFEILEIGVVSQNFEFLCCVHEIMLKVL